MIFSEARRLARSLRTQPGDWQCDPHDWLDQANILVHRPTGWALWIGGGRRQLQPFNLNAGCIAAAWPHPRRYGVIERLIIWNGGARCWYRHVAKQFRTRAQFRGEG